MERRRFFYQRKKNNTICLLRCFGENSCAEIPDQINGLPVTEIGAYCFAENGHLDGRQYETAEIVKDTEIPEQSENAGGTAAPGKFEKHGSGENTGGRYEFDLPDVSAYILKEQCGRYLTEVILPDTLTRLNAYAFYGCRSLKKITFSLNLSEIENDAFMNCTSLSQLDIHGSVTDPGSLKQILTQISWNVETAFYPLKERSAGKIPANRAGYSFQKYQNSLHPEAKLLFAEYLEYYDDLGPAHVFEIQIEGEGYRARQCFLNGVLQLGEYDSTFRKLSSEEKASVACRFALNRLLYPLQLADENRNRFTEFVQNHAAETMKCVLERKEERPEEMMQTFELLFRDHILGKSDLEDLLAKVSEEGMAELAASLIKWKSMYYKEEKKADRYSFDEFF